MNESMWIFLAVAGLLAVLSIVLLSGNGAFLIAGYNTASQEEKSKYDEKKLCRVVGSGLLVLSVLEGLMAFFVEKMNGKLGMIIPICLCIVIVIMIVLANTICKKKYD